MSEYMKLASAIEALFEKQSERKERGTLAYLGFAPGAKYSIAVKGAPNWLWVRIVRGSERTVAQAFNEAQVNRIPDLPVRVTRFGDHWKIIGYDISSIDFLRGMPIGTREPGSGNVDIVGSRRIKPGLVHAYKNPSTDTYGMAVMVEGFTYRYNGTDKRFDGSTVDLSAYIPSANNHRWVKVGIDPDTNTPVVVAGDEHPTTVPLDEDELGSIVFTQYIPLAGVKLVGGQSAVDADGYFADIRPWWSVSGATSSGVSVWDVDLPPVSPSSMDDEFDDGSINVKWTEYDTGSIQTPSESGGQLTLSQASQSTATLTGEYQALPGGNFTFVAKVTLNNVSPTGDGMYWQGGLVLWEDATNDAADAILAGPMVVRQAGNTTKTVGWSNWSAKGSKDTQYADTQGFTISSGTPVYIRLRYNGTTYYLDFSADGESWYTNILSGYIPFTPQYVGIGMSNEASGVTIDVDFDFFRYRNLADDITAPVYGATSLAVSFDRLSDTPSSYSGAAGNAVVVNATEDGLDFDANYRDATKIQGRDVAATAPSDGQALVWDAAGSQWEPGTVSGGGGSTPLVFARIWRSTNQSLPNGSRVPVSFDTEIEDTNNLWDASQPTRITVPHDGLYHAHFVGRFELIGGSGLHRTFSIRVNGSTDDYARVNGYSSGGRPELEVNAILHLLAGDYIEVYAYQDSGGSVDLLSVSHNGWPILTIARIV